MGAIIGFLLGYVLGTRAGDKGWLELQESWNTIRSSEEVRDIIAGGWATGRDLMRQGAGVMAGRLSQPSDRTGLRTVA
ncbi:MAG: hypothetical protein ACHQNA_01495 [Acidimicrobiales bacterium]